MLNSPAEPDATPEGANPPLLNGFSKLDFYKHEKVLVAVSGGSDSTALLHLARNFCADNFPDTQLSAVTVDHGLRAEAADEARAVGLQCDALGIAHEVLAWDGKKPLTGLQNAARQARHRLIMECAARTGASMVLIGHTSDDQAETVAMRHARTGEMSGTHGLAGIAPATLMEKHTWFARPLLGVGRAALRSYLTGNSISWFDDPSNEDGSYERVRIRSGLDAFTKARWMQCAAKASAARTSLATDAAHLLRSGATFSFDDWPQRFTINRHGVMQSASAEVECALRMVLQFFTGDDFPAPQSRLREIADFVATARMGEKKTTGKCVLTGRRDTVLVVHDPRVVRSATAQIQRISSFDWPLANAFERAIGRGELPRPPFV